VGRRRRLLVLFLFSVIDNRFVVTSFIYIYTIFLTVESSFIGIVGTVIVPNSSLTRGINWESITIYIYYHDRIY
jgi:hypothetical protein